MNGIMKPRYLIGLTAAAGLMAVAAPAQAPSFAMLGTLEKGQWSLVERGQGGASKNICLGDATQLLQTEHPGAQCSRYTIRDGADEVTVHYTCGKQGHGRTTVRKETPRLVQIDTQGIRNGQPFSFAYEARKGGGC